MFNAEGVRGNWPSFFDARNHFGRPSVFDLAGDSIPRHAAKVKGVCDVPIETTHLQPLDNAFQDL